MGTITCTATIDQHQGTHEATGLPVHRLHDVVTEVEYLEAVDNVDEVEALADRIHAARVAVEQRCADSRRATKQWIDDHSDGVSDYEDEASLYEQALAAVLS